MPMSRPTAANGSTDSHAVSSTASHVPAPRSTPFTTAATPNTNSSAGSTTSIAAAALTAR